MNLKTLIRKYCPNIKLIRRMLSKSKLKQFDRWKLDGATVLQVEQGKRDLSEVLEECQRKWPEKYVDVAEQAREHYAKGGKELDEKTLSNLLFSFFAYGFNPDEFLSFGFNERSFAERKQYISNRDTNKIVYSLNDIVDIDVFYDKWRTYEMFKPYYQREAICIETHQDLQAFYKFVQKHPRFVKKEVRLSKGNSVSLVDARKMSDPKLLFDKMIEAGKTILEEPIEQSSAMAQLNESSVNTVRLITVKTKEGIEVVDSFMKVGRKGSFVDNGGAGGLLVGIDRTTGSLSTVARDEFANAFEVHPDNGFSFVGYQLPDWEQLFKLANVVSSKMQHISYIGWDFAHTEHGWIVVEGNGGSQLIGPQIVFQEGMKKRFLAIAKRAKSVVPLEL